MAPREKALLSTPMPLTLKWEKRALLATQLAAAEHTEARKSSSAPEEMLGAPRKEWYQGRVVALLASSLSPVKRSKAAM
jgi:hypothetical protein